MDIKEIVDAPNPECFHSNDLIKTWICSILNIIQAGLNTLYPDTTPCLYPNCTEYLSVMYFGIPIGLKGQKNKYYEKVLYDHDLRRIISKAIRN